MADRSKIEWTDSTWSGWIGCTAVGPGQPRARTGADNWAKPRTWNKRHFCECRECGWRGERLELTSGHSSADNAPVCPRCDSEHLQPVRRRVFCSSLSDVFDNEVPAAWRDDLFALIAQTPNLDWMILTKRIANAARYFDEHPEIAELVADGHIWIGATVTAQAEADRDIPKLVEIEAAVRFVSVEPILGALDLSKWLDPWTCTDCGFHGAESDSGEAMCGHCGVPAAYDPVLGSAKCPECGKDDGTDDNVGDSCPNCASVEGWSRDCGFRFGSDSPSLIQWVIVGGESGKRARAPHPDHITALVQQAERAGVPVMFKQWGEWIPMMGHADGVSVVGEKFIHPDGTIMGWAGKHNAGRTLSGRTHLQFPGSPVPVASERDNEEVAA